MPKYTFFIEANVSQEFTISANNKDEATSLAIEKFTSNIRNESYCDIHTLNIVHYESYTPVLSLCSTAPLHDQAKYNKYR